MKSRRTFQQVFQAGALISMTFCYLYYLNLRILIYKNYLIFKIVGKISRFFSGVLILYMRKVFKGNGSSKKKEMKVSLENTIYEEKWNISYDKSNLWTEVACVILGKDSKGMLLNESSISQDWHPDFHVGLWFDW